MNNWTEIKVFVPTENLERVCSDLEDIGIRGFVIDDDEDWEQFIKEKRIPCDYVEDGLISELKSRETGVTVYVPENEQGEGMLAEIRALGLKTQTAKVCEDDWAHSWKQYFKPLKIGEKLVVKPTWEEYTESDGRIVLEIDPASSFGTGQHETTRLCLELLERTVTENCRVLDVGCGSGILSIGALLLGAGSVCAVDTDENAVSATEENILKNGIPKENYSVFCGNILENEDLSKRIGDGYDIITANIVADVIIALGEYFFKALKAGGTLLVSGIITPRRDEVDAALKRSGFVCTQTVEDNGWVAMSLGPVHTTARIV